MTRLSKHSLQALASFILVVALMLSTGGVAQAHPLSPQEAQALNYALRLMPPDLQEMFIISLGKMSHEGLHTGLQRLATAVQRDPQIVHQYAYLLRSWLVLVPPAYRQLVLDGLLEVSPEAVELARRILLQIAGDNEQLSALAAAMHASNMRNGQMWTCSLGGGNPVGSYCLPSR